MTPKPAVRIAPDEIAFELGLDGVEANKLFPYLVRALGVRRWSLDGTWDKNLQVSFDPAFRSEAPIALCQLVPGRLVLECEQLTVEKLPAKRYRPPPRPREDNFLVYGDRELSWNQLLGLIAPPSEMGLYTHGTKAFPQLEITGAQREAIIRGPLHWTYHIKTPDVERPWLYIHWGMTPEARGHYLTVTRGTIDDANWARVRRLPGALGPCTVWSGNIRCSGGEWLDKWCGPSP